MAITNKQRIAMAVIVLAGLLGGAAVLMTERHKSGQEAEHAEGDGHEHKEGGHNGARRKSMPTR